MCDHGEQHSCSHSLSVGASVSQSLDELEFERGIWQAAIDNDLSKVKLLTGKGTSVNIKDNSGYTALHYAARAGNIEIAKYLLDSGADPNSRTKTGRDTPLHRAAYQGHDVMVSLLLQRGADPMLQNSDGQTALHKAASMKRTEVVKLLLVNSPSLVSIKDNRDNTANIS